MSTTQEHAVASLSPLAVAVLGGLAGGALDLLFAFLFYGPQGATPPHILQFIASGALGRESFELGTFSVALGVFLHFFISACAALIFYFASGHFPFLTRRVLLSGMVFGVLMFLTMRFVVVPLSAAKSGPMKPANVIAELCSHMFLFGTTIAYAVARARRHHIRSSGTTKLL